LKWAKVNSSPVSHDCDRLCTSEQAIRTKSRQNENLFFVLIGQLPFFSWDYIGVRLGVEFRVGIRVMIKISF